MVESSHPVNGDDDLPRIRFDQKPQEVDCSVCTAAVCWPKITWQNCFPERLRENCRAKVLATSRRKVSPEEIPVVRLLGSLRAVNWDICSAPRILSGTSARASRSATPKSDSNATSSSKKYLQIFVAPPPQARTEASPRGLNRASYNSPKVASVPGARPGDVKLRVAWQSSPILTRFVVCSNFSTSRSTCLLCPRFL